MNNRTNPKQGTGHGLPRYPQSAEVADFSKYERNVHDNLAILHQTCKNNPIAKLFDKTGCALMDGANTGTFKFESDIMKRTRMYIKCANPKQGTAAFVEEATNAPAFAILERMHEHLPPVHWTANQKTAFNAMKNFIIALKKGQSHTHRTINAIFETAAIYADKGRPLHTRIFLDQSEQDRRWNMFHELLEQNLTPEDLAKAMEGVSIS